MKRYTISQLARAANVPISTLRYYERVGLVCPTERADNNYRVYSAQTLQTIRFIRAAQAAGFTLDDIRALLGLQAGNTALCKDVEPLIEKRLQDVSRRIKDMRHVQRMLKSFLEMCHTQEEDAACPVVDTLFATRS
jgi:DNA-binding transcriptional MerR regulator